VINQTLPLRARNDQNQTNNWASGGVSNNNQLQFIQQQTSFKPPSSLRTRPNSAGGSRFVSREVIRGVSSINNNGNGIPLNNNSNNNITNSWAVRGVESNNFGSINLSNAGYTNASGDELIQKQETTINSGTYRQVIFCFNVY
jgi:hypothetical protein